MTTRSLTLSIIALILTLANALVVITYFISRRLRTAANRFVVSLAFSDLLVSCFLIPVMAWKPLSPAVGPLTAFALLSSLGNICGCTYDRYTAIKHPLLYSAIMTRKRFICIMIISWGIPALFAAVPQIWVNNLETFHMNAESLNNAMKIYVGFMIITVLVICIILVCIYIYIFKVAKRHYKSMSCAQPQKTASDTTLGSINRKRRPSVKNFFSNIKSTLLFAILGINFIFCWLPFTITNMFYAFGGYELLSSKFLFASEIFMYANSLINPITYAFFQKEFQRAFMRLFRTRNHVAPSKTTLHSNTERNTNIDP